MHRSPDTPMCGVVQILFATSSNGSNGVGRRSVWADILLLVIENICCNTLA